MAPCKSSKVQGRIGINDSQHLKIIRSLRGVSPLLGGSKIGGSKIGGPIIFIYIYMHIEISIKI